MARRPHSAALDSLALTVSALSSPFMVLPFFLFVLASHLALSRRDAYFWTLVAVGGLVGLPLLYIIFMVRRGHLTDIHVQLREQRQGPFLVALAGAALSTLGLVLADAPVELQLATGAAVFNGVLLAAITRRWKISMHPSVLVACVVVVGMLVSPRWLWALASLPVVLWARVRRGRHDWAQGLAAVVVAGGLTAVLVRIWLGLVGTS